MHPVQSVQSVSIPSPALPPRPDPPADLLHPSSFLTSPPTHPAPNSPTQIRSSRTAALISKHPAPNFASIFHNRLSRMNIQPSPKIFSTFLHSTRPSQPAPSTDRPSTTRAFLHLQRAAKQRLHQSSARVTDQPPERSSEPVLQPEVFQVPRSKALQQIFPKWTLRGLSTDASPPTNSDAKKGHFSIDKRHLASRQHKHTGSLASIANPVSEQRFSHQPEIMRTADDRFLCTGTGRQVSRFSEPASPWLDYARLEVDAEEPNALAGHNTSHVLLQPFESNIRDEKRTSPTDQPVNAFRGVASFVETADLMSRGKDEWTRATSLRPRTPSDKVHNRTPAPPISHPISLLSDIHDHKMSIELTDPITLAASNEHISPRKHRQLLLENSALRSKVHQLESKLKEASRQIESLQLKCGESSTSPTQNELQLSPIRQHNGAVFAQPLPLAKYCHARNSSALISESPPHLVSQLSIKESVIMQTDEDDKDLQDRIESMDLDSSPRTRCQHPRHLKH